MDENTTLGELTRDGWQVIKRGEFEYYFDAEKAILRTHIRLHSLLADAIAGRPQWSQSRAGKLGFMKAAEVALASHPEAPKLLEQLRILNSARNTLAHELYTIPRLEKVLPVFRFVLPSRNLGDELPDRELSERFMEALQSWEADVLAAARVAR